MKAKIDFLKEKGDADGHSHLMAKNITEELIEKCKNIDDGGLEKWTIAMQVYSFHERTWAFVLVSSFSRLATFSNWRSTASKILSIGG